MHVSIIIVHYNSKIDTDECLQSLSNISRSGFNYNVIVVDNASREDYILPAIENGKRFEVVRSESNLGFTGGNNLGIYYAIEKYNSDFVLLLNNDTIVDASFLRNLLDCADQQPMTGLVCPKIYFHSGREFHADSYLPKQRGSIIWYAGGSIDWENIAAFHRGVDEVDRGQFDLQMVSEFATGCCVLIRREVLEKVGMFDKRFFLYFEDVDLSQRTIQAGYSVGFCPQAIVWHKNAGSSGGVGSIIHQYYIARNRLLFAFKHGSWTQKMVALRILLMYIFRGDKYEKTAVWHFIAQKFGKQQVV
jgi:GT2 family glycosyltransferase